MARNHLIACIRRLESRPSITKTAIKAEIFADRSVDWRSLRQEELRQPEGLRTPNWKTNLISQLLMRNFPHKWGVYETKPSKVFDV